MRLQTRRYHARRFFIQTTCITHSPQESAASACGAPADDVRTFLRQLEFRSLDVFDKQHMVPIITAGVVLVAASWQRGYLPSIFEWQKQEN